MNRTVLDDVRREIRPSIVSLARKLKRTPDYAESIINEGIAHLIININNAAFQGNSNVYTYLKRICSNLFLLEERKNDFLNNAKPKSKKDEKYPSSEQITDVRGKKVSFSDEFDIDKQIENSDEIEQSVLSQDDEQFAFPNIDERVEIPQGDERSDISNDQKQFTIPHDNEEDYDLLTKAFAKMGNTCKQFILMVVNDIPDLLIAEQLGYKNVNSVYNLRLTCREQAIKHFADADRSFRKPFHLVKTDIFAIDNYISGSLTKNEIETFQKKLKADKNLELEYQFVKTLNKIAKKYRLDSLKSEIMAISEEINIPKNKKVQVESLDIEATISTQRRDDGKTFCSIDDMIENLFIEKSIIENNGDEVPPDVLLTIRRLQEIKEEIKKGIFERFDL